MGSYYFKRNNLYKKLINLYQLNLDNFTLQNRTKLNNILNRKVKNYDKFIEDQMISERNISLYKQVNTILLRDFFNFKR